MVSAKHSVIVYTHMRLQQLADLLQDGVDKGLCRGVVPEIIEHIRGVIEFLDTAKESETMTAEFYEMFPLIELIPRSSVRDPHQALYYIVGHELQALYAGLLNRVLLCMPEL